MNTATVSHKRHHFPPRIITHPVWPCYRFPLSGVESRHRGQLTPAASDINAFICRQRGIANSGNDSLTGGAGNDVFIFGPSFGKDTITDFAAGGSSVDAIEFDDDVFADFASVLAAVSRVGSDTLIAVNVNTRVMLKNVALANLH